MNKIFVTVTRNTILPHTPCEGGLKAFDSKLFVTVTRNTILTHTPCEGGLKAFDSKFGDLDPDTPVPLLACLESNPIADVLWALRAVQQDIRHLLPLIAADFAESVLPLFESRFPGDKRPRVAIETVRAFVRGEVSREVLEKARSAAAANAAAYATAYAAAYAAANAAADATANAAANAAANASRDAAAYAAYAANVARDAERVKQAEILKRYFSETPL